MHQRTTAATLLAVLLACAPCAVAEGAFSEGKWRLEISAHSGLDIGADRSGDVLLLSTVEYEIPLSGHVALGLKLHPLFTYEQDELDIDHFLGGGVRSALRDLEFDFDAPDRGGDSVWGGGIGLGVRIYQVKTERRGLFLDLGVSALAHTGELNKDDSNLDFKSGVGLGYQFAFGLNTQVRFDHLSNASLGNENAGSNMVGLGLGFRF